MMRVVREDFLEEMSCEEGLKVRREVEGINITGCLGHLKPVYPGLAEPQWLRQQRLISC